MKISGILNNNQLQLTDLRGQLTLPQEFPYFRKGTIKNMVPLNSSVWMTRYNKYPLLSSFSVKSEKGSAAMNSYEQDHVKFATSQL